MTLTLNKNRAKNHDSSIKSKRPLVIFFTWLWATPEAVKKYELLYSQYDAEFMVYNIELKDFLWPKIGLQNSLQLLQDLKTKLKAEKFIRPVIIHSFSIGCYFYALLLWHMKKNPSLHNVVRGSIVAQIIDSPVVGSLNEMAHGISITLSSNSKIRERMCKCLCMLYFAITKSHTVRYYEEALSIIKYDIPRVPTLTFASEGDSMCKTGEFQNYVEAWRRNQYVRSKVFRDSVHIKHFKHHPEEYTKLIEELLARSLHPSPMRLKSKL